MKHVSAIKTFFFIFKCKLGLYQKKVNTSILNLLLSKFKLDTSE